MPQEMAFATPRAEEITRVIAGGAGAGITGLIEGVIVKMAPQMGAAAPILTWGTMLGVPLVGTFGALFTRGMLGDLMQGVAYGGLGVLGYTLPELIAPAVGRRARGQGQLGEGAGVKQLGAGAASALQRAQAGARVGLEI